MSLLLALLLAQTAGYGYCPAGQVVQSIPRNGPPICAVAGGGGGAPTTAQYWVAGPDGGLSAEVNLGALATALVLNTAGTPSAYAGGTCTAPNFVRVISATGAVTCAAPTLSLSQITNPTGDTTFTFPSGTKTLWEFSGATDFAFSIHGTGAFTGTGDLVHFHMQGTASAAGSDVLHLEFADADVTGLRVTGTGAASQSITVDGKITAGGLVAAPAGFIGPLTGAVTGNASTATALAADPTDCTVGQAARGINASGTATGCFTPSGGGGGGGTYVTVDVDFGAGGNALAKTVVTGQTWVTAASSIVCSPTMYGTASRSEGAEDPVLEGMAVAAHSRVAGTGFTLTAAPRFGNAYGIYTFACTAGDGTSVGALSAGVDQSVIDAGCSGAGTCAATTPSVSCYGYAGTGTYTYSWAYVSGVNATINTPAAQSTTFTRTASVTSFRTGVFRCTVNDGSTTASADVTVQTLHEP